MSERPAVEDWSTDYDIMDPGFVADPYPIWADLRETCPIPHTERWEGSWMPTRYEDIRAIANDVETFSSWNPLVIPNPNPEAPDPNAPPITSDPPVHHGARRILLPAFSPKATERHVDYTRDLCRRLLRGFIEQGRVDAAAGYAQQIPPRVIAHLIGIDEERADEFVGWVRGVLELGLTDVFRLFEQPEKAFSWWDYRRAGFQRNAGLRIDLILTSEAMTRACQASYIDREPRTWERPSDHTPVIAEFDI